MSARPAGASVTSRDVARLADVHSATVSRALNPRTRGLVSPETAHRVLEAAESLGYRPNWVARTMRTGRSYTVGVLVPDITNPLFPPIVRGVEDGLAKPGYTPLIANTDNNPERERLALGAMRARQIDGVISAAAREGGELLRDLAASGIPVVLVNRTTRDGSLPSVVAGDAAGIRLAVIHLAELGHRRIAHVAGSQEISTGRHRYEAFARAVRQLDLPSDERLIAVGGAPTVEEGARSCAELLDRGARFTAIVAANDLMALGCYEVLKGRGLECPAQVSVVGFNDMPFSARFRPALTTVRIPHYQLGFSAARLLLDLIEGRNRTPRRFVLAPTLVVRASTARAVTAARAAGE